MPKEYAEIDATGMRVPTPSQIKASVEKHGGPPVAFVRVEMNGWWREFAVFNPKAFIENPRAQDQAMTMFKDELSRVITNGLNGPAPKDEVPSGEITAHEGG